MLLGNFVLGSTVRIPLQISEGGIPVTEATNIRVHKILKPNNAAESGYPKAMKVADSSFAVYYSDYKPKSVGNYMVIFSFVVDSVTFTSMDSFYISAPTSSGNPYARSVSRKNASAKGL